MQNTKFYIRFEDEKLIPIEQTQLRGSDTGYISTKTGNEDFNLVLSKYKLKKFSQAFPTAKSEWLQKVYIIDGETALFEDLRNQKFTKGMANIEPLCEPELLYTPNDYGLVILQTNLDLIKVKQAWDIVGDLPIIPIGITDTYFDTNHEDLNNQFLTIRGANNDATEYHGTAVAGILGAITNNGKGIASISLGTKLYASTDWASDNEVLLLAQQGYRVINCSWLNACSPSTVQENLYKEIRDVWNTVVVFGAGNSANQCGSLDAKIYPASYSSVLSVTSIGHTNDIGYIVPGYGPIYWKDCHIMDMSTGASYHHNDAVDICAPGYAVPTVAPNNQYSSGNWGTSFAAPHVAATVCLILSINPCLSAAQAMDMVKNTADASIYSISYNAPYIGLLGTGRLDAATACIAASQSATRTFSTSTVLSGTQTIESNYAIRTTAPVQVTSGSNVLFKTRKEVELNSGFEVAAGATFEVNVNPNNTVICN